MRTTTITFSSTFVEQASHKTKLVWMIPDDSTFAETTDWRTCIEIYPDVRFWLNCTFKATNSNYCRPNWRIVRNCLTTSLGSFYPTTIAGFAPLKSKSKFPITIYSSTWKAQLTPLSMRKINEDLWGFFVEFSWLPSDSPFPKQSVDQ